MKRDIIKYLSKSPLLFDGAMGTYIAEKEEAPKEPVCERLNLTHPELIQEIHEEYLQAGAVAIKTNTFAVHEGNHFSKEQVVKTIESGVSIARKALDKAQGERFLFGDIGPVPADDAGEIMEKYQLVVDTFLQHGVNDFVMETLGDHRGISEIVAYIKEKDQDSFVMVSYGVSPEGFTRGGCYGRSLYTNALQDENIDCVGFNCISGPKHMLDLVHRLQVKEAGKYISIMPNAGYPTILSNRTYYGENDNYFAEQLLEMTKAGVAIVGGCCGTTPGVIQRISELLLENPVTGIDPALLAAMKQNAEIDFGENNPLGNMHNAFASKLSQGEKVLVVELDPPVEPDIEFFMEGAARYKAAGVDAIDIADCPVAKARIDSSILACKITRELGMTAIPHMTCRDRNINATKALLLGLNVEGVNNVLTVTGDPVAEAERQTVKTMFSYNSAVLANHIQTLNTQMFKENPFMVSGALNVNAHNFDSQIKQAKRKIESGVKVLFTQPILTGKGFANLKRAKEELDVKILGGIMPVVSYRNACFMNNEMGGIEVDDRILEAYKDKDRQQGEELAWEISTRIAREIAPYVDGFYLITPFKRVELILRIIESIKCI